MRPFPTRTWGECVGRIEWYPPLATCNLCVSVVQYVFHALSCHHPDGSLFLNKMADQSAKYRTSSTPAGWTFNLWIVVYAWQGVWIVYSLTNIFRKGHSGKPAYTDPQFLPNILFVLSILAAILNISWMISFDRGEIEVACGVTLAYTLVLWAALYTVYLTLDKASPRLVDQNRTVDIWLTRGLVLNGIALQATWATLASLLSIQIVMVHNGEDAIESEDAGTIILTVLAILLIASAVYDLCCLDRTARYTLIPYIVVVVTLSGSLATNWDPDGRNSILIVILLVGSCIRLVVKLVFTFYNNATKPRFNTDVERNPGEIKSKDEV